MNCLVSWERRVCTKRSARRRPGWALLGCGAVDMMRALYSIQAGLG
jgi:hypothetical protein